MLHIGDNVMVRFENMCANGVIKRIGPAGWVFLPLNKIEYVVDVGGREYNVGAEHLTLLDALERWDAEGTTR